MALAHHLRMAKQPHYIRQWRKYRGLTLEQLAERIGMTHQNLGKIERFKVAYTQPLLEHLAEELRTDEASLIMRDPSMPEAIWTVYEALTPPQKRQAEQFMKALKLTGTVG